MKTRDYRRKVARKTSDPLAWAGYKNFKREVRRELRFAEQEYAETQEQLQQYGLYLENYTFIYSKKVSQS